MQMQSGSTMEYGQAFTFPQQETDWIKKTLIGAALMLIPVIGGWVVSGYSLDIARRVAVGESPLMPEWDDFGKYLKLGFFGAVVSLVYALPLIVLGGLFALPFIGAALFADSDGGEALLVIANVVSVCCGCLILLYGLAMSAVLPAALGRLAVTDEIPPALRVNEVIALVRAQPGPYIITALLSSLAISILASIGSIACGVGALIGVAYGLLIAGHLYGQAYRLASGGVGHAPAAPATPAMPSA